ncbi:MAG: DUF6520 family protein [Arenibacter latericius]|nr:DUF6520 family protein [Arenibacter latericius]
MKKLKIILPMLAFVLAVGMSFAFVNTTAEDYYATKFILVDGVWTAIEVECNPLNDACTVMYTQDPQQREFIVYNSQNTGDPAEGDGQVIMISSPLPNSDL